MTRIKHRAAADAVEIGDLDRRVGVVDRIVGIARTTVRTDVEIVELTRLPIASGARISDGFIQSPCSRQRMCIFVSAKLQAMAAPEAPAPMIRTSTGVVMQSGPGEIRGSNQWGPRRIVNACCCLLLSAATSRSRRD
jgi:hypothetical protein